MVDRQFNGMWNVARVLQEYMYFTDDRGNVSSLNLSGDSPYGIKMRRLVAAMKAYGKDVCLHHGMESLISDTCSNEKMDELCLLLRQYLHDKHSEALAPDLLKGVHERKDLFEALFRYRKSLYRVESLWAGMIECSRTIALAYRLTSNLNQTQIKAVSDVIDRMLVLLMGDDYDKTFSEDELLPFGYPYVTDKELEDMIFDNW